MAWEVVLPAVLVSVVHLSPQYFCSLVFRSTPGQRLLVPGWYGEGDRVIEICTRTAVWYHTGLPPVLIRDPAQRFDPQALLCTAYGPEIRSAGNGVGYGHELPPTPSRRQDGCGHSCVGGHGRRRTLVGTAPAFSRVCAEPGRQPKKASRLLLRTVTLPALAGIMLIVPFRRPRNFVELALWPVIVTATGTTRLPLSAWRVPHVQYSGPQKPSSLVLPLLAVILLLIFQLI
jgi:hypothetical protein